MKKTKGRPVSPIKLSEEEQLELKRRVGAQKTSRRDNLRATIILKRASGMSQAEVAAALGCSQTCVSKWTARFRKSGLSGLLDASGRGRKASVELTRVEAAITRVNRPPKGRERWSVRTMARELGISASTVARIWRANGLKPHRVELFKISNDPKFEEKFWDVIGLYLNPPDRAIVLCCDEKSQCQALERTQKALPLTTGHAMTFTHDYILHGTLTLFAALNYLEGKVFSRIEERHTHKEWLRFLKQVDRDCPAGLTLHIVLDNYAPHKEPTVISWLERVNKAYEKQHGLKRIELHFTPTSSSWMNLVERFFGAVT